MTEKLTDDEIVEILLDARSELEEGETLMGHLYPPGHQDWFAPAGLNRELPPEPPVLDEPEKLELIWKTDDGTITLHKNENDMMRLGLVKWGGSLYSLYLTEDELEQLRKMLNERHFCEESEQSEGANDNV